MRCASRAESRLLNALNSQTDAGASPAEDRVADVRQASGCETIMEIQQEIVSLRDAILRHDSAGLKAQEQRPVVVVPSPPPPADDNPEPKMQWNRSDIRSELQAWGCPECNHLMDAAFEFYRKFQYKLSVDGPTQRLFADHLGFCRLHTWQLAAIASPQGLSLGYPRLLERMSATLSSLLDRPLEAFGPVAALIPNHANCQVCGLLRAEEHKHLWRLVSSCRIRQSGRLRPRPRFLPSASGRAAGRVAASRISCVS